MGRKFLSIAISLLIILNMGMAFGLETKTAPLILAEELIIGEPTTDVVYSNKVIYATVNITGKSMLTIQDHPAQMMLIRIEDKLPFSDELDKDLNVPIIKLSSSALLKESPQAIYTIVNPTLEEQKDPEDETHKVETEIINDYFESVDKINTLNAEITSANKKYKLDALTEADLVKATKEIKDAHKKWSTNKSSLFELKKSFEQTQALYLSLFENNILIEKISKPSRNIEIGKLEIGKYKLRFVDEKGVFIKEIVFEVVKEDDTLKTISPTISVNDNTDK